MSPVVGWKCCGSCNPEIDLVMLSRDLESEAEARDIELVHLTRATTALAGLVLLCGCPRACLERAEVRALAPHVVVVAGRKVAPGFTPESSLASAVLDVIESW